MKTFHILIIYAIVCLLISLPCFVDAQTEDMKYPIEDVLNAMQSDFDKLKEGEKDKWTTSDGNTYGIKNENGKKATFIEFGGKMVRHGSYYLYGKTYGANSIEYLREMTHYVYGEKNGLSEIYSVSKNKPYLKESVNYSYGLRHGEYLKYGSNGNMEKSGFYRNGIMFGSWRHYYQNGSIMYEYNYEGYTATRYSYQMVSKPEKEEEKGKLTATTPYQYFTKNGRGRWEKHGIANIVKYDGSNVEKYYYEGKEVDYARYAAVPATGNSTVGVECVKEAADIRALLANIKTENDQTRVIKKIGEEICVYLETYEPDDSFWDEPIRVIKQKILEYTQRECTDEDVRYLFQVRKSTCMCTRG